MPAPDQLEIESLLAESARSAFGTGEDGKASKDGGHGILRIEWSSVVDGVPELLVIPRALGPEPVSWRAATSAATHPGPAARRNTKFVEVDAYDVARGEVRNSELDEVLLFDEKGRLVEGGKSNFIVVTDTGQLVTPDLALGAVEGLGLSLVLESRLGLAIAIDFAELTHENVASARELMSVNSVRGVVPIIELDGHPIADGQPGPFERRLASLFDSGARRRGDN